MMPLRRTAGLALALGIASALVAAPADAAESAHAVESADAVEPVKVVYHLNEGVDQARRALGNIRNHLNAAPDSGIVVVAHGRGIDFLLGGATDANGRGFEGAIGELAGRGVQFRVCGNTLAGRDLAADHVVLEASVVESGVAEIARLQAREGYVYLRP